MPSQKEDRDRERKSEGRLLKAVQHWKHGFKAPASQQVDHHIEYLAVCHTLSLVIKYISHYNHLGLVDTSNLGYNTSLF